MTQPSPAPQQAFHPEQMLLEANLREFAREVTTICALETGGKLSPAEAYHLIQRNWHRLKACRSSLLSPRH